MRKSKLIESNELQNLETRILMANDPLGVTLSKGLLTINGSKFDDQIVVTYDGSSYQIANGTWNLTKTGTISKVIVNGKAGSDTITLTSVIIPATLIGDLGNDNLTSSNSNSSLNGGAGDDSLTSGSGNDMLIGDAGNDIIDAGDGSNTINGGLGDDSLTGGDGADSILGGLGNDTFVGGGGIDTLSYTDHSVKQPVVITLDGTNTGGMLGETDSIAADFEIIYGGAGNDLITGSDNAEIIYGMGGNDSIYAGDGADKIYGGAGNDNLYGQDGNDSIYAGAGNDLSDGGNDDDLLIDLGGGVLDSLTGGDGVDTFWLDSNVTELVNDASTDETNLGAIHRVSSFANKIAKDLNSQAIADPVLTNKTIKYRNFKTNPIFSSNGPSINDIRQGQLGNCYFLSQIASFAMLDQNTIEQSIVDFGDGTYGVQFQKNGAKVFYRIDADLPSYSAGTLAYAAFGAEGSIWVSLLEKAWAYFRKGKNSYASTEAGFMTEVTGAFGKSSTWGWTNSNPDSVLAQLKSDYEAGKSITVGTSSSQPGGSLLIGGHAYTLYSIVSDGNGGYTIILRNPWAVDGYSSADGNQDGYVTMTGTQFSAWTNSYAVSAV